MGDAIRSTSMTPASDDVLPASAASYIGRVRIPCWVNCGPTEGSKGTNGTSWPLQVHDDCDDARPETIPANTTLLGATATTEPTSDGIRDAASRASSAPLDTPSSATRPSPDRRLRESHRSA